MKPFKPCLFTAVLSLTIIHCTIHCKPFYDSWSCVSFMQMTCCFGHFRWLYSLSMWLMWMICRRHIFPTKISTRVQPRDWSSVQLFGCPALQVNPCHYVQPCRADDFYVRRSRLNIAVFWTGRGFQALLPNPILPQSISRFPLLCGKGQHVYIWMFLSDNGPLSTLPAPCCETHQSLHGRSAAGRLGHGFFRLAMIINLDALHKT